MIMHLAEIDLRFLGCNAERLAGGEGVGVLAGSEQCLGRHAAIVQAVAAHLATLDEHHVLAELAGRSRHRQATGARSDDADITIELFHLAALIFLKMTGISATKPSAAKAASSSGVTSAPASSEKVQF
jgi:hypothetical protein